MRYMYDDVYIHEVYINKVLGACKMNIANVYKPGLGMPLSIHRVLYMDMRHMIEARGLRKPLALGSGSSILCLYNVNLCYIFVNIIWSQILRHHLLSHNLFREITCINKLSLAVYSDMCC